MNYPKQKNIDADAKKQSPVPSKPTMTIFDEGIDTNKKQEPPKPTQKPTNPNVLANANNKFETHQKEEQAPQQVLKKKKKGPNHKKKNRNKNRSDWAKNHKNNGIAADSYRNWNNNNSNHSRNNHYNDTYHPHPHPHQRSNNQDYFSHEEANMFANQNPPTGFQTPFAAYIRGSDHTFPVPHPQHQHQHHQHQQQLQQQHIFADDGNQKVLVDPSSDGGGVHPGDRHSVFHNCNGNIHGTQYNVELQHANSCNSWMDMIDDNTQVLGVVLSHNNGESQPVPIPPAVGACLAKELLVQKENYKAAPNNHADEHIDEHNAHKTIESTQERPVQGNTAAPGFGDQRKAMSSSSASWDHQQSRVMVTRSGDPHSRPYIHPYPGGHPNGHPNGHLPYGLPLNHPQPYNGCGSFPPSGNNGGMHMAAPTSYHPMMSNQVQYAQMYSVQYPPMASIANAHQPIGYPGPGYTGPNDLNGNSDHTTSSDGTMNGEIRANAEGCGNEHHHVSNGRSNMEATPNRSGVNQGDGIVVVEGADHAQVHNRNQNAVTPHRGAIGGNGEGDARRVSFSPMVPSSQTPGISSNGNTM